MRVGTGGSDLGGAHHPAIVAELRCLRPKEGELADVYLLRRLRVIE